MIARPKLRQTRRTLRAENLYEDRARCRFVVYRRAGGVTRKTSVRYGDNTSRAEAHSRAEYIARKLHYWPADKLAKFRFTP